MSENLPAIWQPSPFPAGSDLLPLDLAGPRDRIGQENVKSEDLLLPTMQLLQGMSEPCTRGEEGAKPGIFWHNGVRMPLPGPLRVLGVHHSRGRALLPKTGNARYVGLEMCVSRDQIEGSKYGDCASCQHKEWGPNSETPLCVESHNFVVMTKYGPALLRVPLSNKENRTTARNFLTSWVTSGKAIWSHPLVVASKQQTKKMGPGQKDAVYYTLDLRWAREDAVPPPALAAAREFHLTVNSANEAGKLHADDEAPTGDDHSPSPADLGDLPF